MTNKNKIEVPEENLLLKPLKFSQRIDKYISLFRNIEDLRSQYDLESKMVNISMSKYYELFAPIAKKILNVNPEEQEFGNILEEVKVKMQEKRQAEIPDFFTALHNQVLVLICTIIDVFLLDSFRVVSNNNPNVLKFLASEENDITVSDVLSSKDYEMVCKILQERVLNRFDFKSIEDKIELFKDFGIGFEGIDLDKLFDIYNKRKDIVHRDEKPISNFDTLAELSNFSSGVILYIGLKLGQHFNIATDFELFTFVPDKINID